MKIDTANIIRIAGHAGAADALRKLEVGSELSARVVERHGRSAGGRISVTEAA